MCDTHLSDAQFATPVIDEDVTAAKAKLVALDAEITQLKTSIEARKKASKGYFNFGFSKSKDDKDKDKPKDKEAAQLEKDEGLLEKLQEARDTVKTTAEKQPRIFSLAKQFYSMRIMNRINAQMAQQTKQKLGQPDLFPATPTHKPGEPL